MTKTLQGHRTITNWQKRTGRSADSRELHRYRPQTISATTISAT